MPGLRCFALMTAMPDSSHSSADLEAARRVLAVEGDALAALARSLDGQFTKAIDLIIGIEGRVIVSGMGKSGHIGNKIAATFASTGTPAQFVHPGEASHGDLGFITRKDAALLLSNSGKTQELTDIIDFTRRNAHSDDRDHGGRGLGLGAACGRGVDPAARDARPAPIEIGAHDVDDDAAGAGRCAGGGADGRGAGLQRTIIANCIRAGRLGRKLVRVADIMHAGTELPLVDENKVMSEVLIEITSKRFGCAGVMNARRRTDRRGDRRRLAAAYAERSLEAARERT